MLLITFNTRYHLNPVLFVFNILNSSSGDRADRPLECGGSVAVATLALATTTVYDCGRNEQWTQL